MFGKIRAWVKEKASSISNAFKSLRLHIKHVSLALPGLLSLAATTEVDISSIITIVVAILPLVVTVYVIKMLINVFRGLGGK